MLPEDLTAHLDWCVLLKDPPSPPPPPARQLDTRRTETINIHEWPLGPQENARNRRHGATLDSICASSKKGGREGRPGDIIRLGLVLKSASMLSLFSCWC